MLDKYETPHILTKVINPVTENISLGRILIVTSCFSMFGIEIAIFIASFPHLFFTPFFGLSIVLTIAFAWIYGRTEKAYNHHYMKACFKIRKFRKLEFIYKHSEKFSYAAIRNLTGWLGMNEETGMSRYVPNKNINMSFDNEFNGNWGFDLVAIPPAESDKKTYNANLRDAFQSLPEGCMEKDILISGQDITFIANEIEELLQDPNLTPTRRDELYSIQEEFINSEGYIDWIYLIHIGLPYTQFEEKAYQKMLKVREGYERILNSMDIKTILIKDAVDIVLLNSGILTGEMLWSGLNES